MKKIILFVLIILSALMVHAQTTRRRTEVRDAHDRYANKNITDPAYKKKQPPRKKQTIPNNANEPDSLKPAAAFNKQIKNYPTLIHHQET
ncbi:MAG: hypothetical protein JSS70_09465 [Bacteroidetes bacterium]|nr:hypothetical protein [Bacteroidota bacterium]